MQDFYEFNTETSNWSKIVDATGSIPCPRLDMTFGCVNRELLLFGGYGKESRAFSQVYSYSPVRKHWALRHFAQNKVQQGRIFSSTSIVRKSAYGEQKMVIFGGKTSVLGENEKDVLVLNFGSENHWWSLHFLLATKV